MMIKHAISSAILLALTLVSSCATPQVEPMGPKGPELQSISATEIKAEAKALMDAQGIGANTQTILMGRLDEFLVEERIVSLMDEKGATAVAVYSAGDGGFLYKGGNGTGTANFSGGDQGVAFKLKGYTVGAVIGGGANHGIAVAFGLKDQRRFAGNYSMTGVKAKAGSKGVATGIANYEGEFDHEIRYISTGSGASADIGIGKFSVEFGK